ncbi:MAG: glycerol-3-phosphate acyltransferase, partial [Candidatus Pacebacteria bacterium]|nr:glycerol-3-phosphate acyltransferase [Candidatus Paceibacterota bacterium]
MSEYLLIPILFISAYILGAIPFAYIFTWLFSKKDITKVGWKKSSSSNVLKNIGKMPALLTFICDVLKGFIVVYIAQELGLSFTVQAIAGFLAIVGHNWSIFLNFKGGRGIATILGACLAFNPIIGVVVLIPVILTALFWTASVGTLFAYIMVIVWGYLIQDFGLFLLFTLSLIPIILKRILPFNTLKGNVFNRIVFDQDSVPPLRV